MLYKRRWLAVTALSFSVQILIGMLIINGFAVLNLLFAWLSVQKRSQRFSASQEAV